VPGAGEHPEAQRSREVCPGRHRILTVRSFEEASILLVFSQYNDQIPKPNLPIQLSGQLSAFRFQPLLSRLLDL
jgi:hypothetical protein